MDKGWIIVVSDAVKKEVIKKKITPEDFEERLKEYPLTAVRLFEEIREQGYDGCYTL